MKLFFILISIIVLVTTPCLAISNSEDVLPIGPFTLYAEATKAGFFKGPQPFVFVEFVNEDSVYGYVGYYPYKGIMYDGCWLFSLKKESPTEYSANGVVLGYDCNDFNKLRLTKNATGWVLLIEEYEQEIVLKNIDGCSYNQITQNAIYASAVLSVHNCQVKDSRNIYHGDGLYSESIFRLPFVDFREKVNAMTFPELRALLHFE